MKFVKIPKNIYNEKFSHLSIYPGIYARMFLDDYIYDIFLYTNDNFIYE